MLSSAAGVGGFFAMWVITQVLVAYHLSLENTYLDEFLVGLLIALLVFAIELYHKAQLRRIRQAAQVMGQLNHYIRNSLQVILYSCSMPPSMASQQAVRDAVHRIEWVLQELVQQSELFSGVSTYLGEHRAEVDLSSLLKKPPETSQENTGLNGESSEKKQAG
jgi:hypothetical protein